jgi:hypothetical protein
LEPEGDWGTGAISWVGNSCILYTRTPSKEGAYNHEGDEVRLLNLNTNQSQGAKSLLTFPQKTVAGLIEASDAASIRQSNDGEELVIETNGKGWMFPNAEYPRITDGASAHVLGGWSATEIPKECK